MNLKIRTVFGFDFDKKSSFNKDSYKKIMDVLSNYPFKLDELNNSYGYIEINNLEDLFDLSVKLNEEIIINPNKELEIYNDYRE